MRSKLNSKLGIYLILFSITFFIRLPFFFRDYIDRDESTFILMAQSLIDGCLPYTQLWDLKPPLVFYTFAVPIYFFGKSLLAIRLLGVIYVATTAFFTYKVSLQFYNKTISLISAVLSVYLLSLFGAMQGVMSEHLAVLPLVIGIYLLLKHRLEKHLFLIGFVFGLAVMYRLNLAYAIVFIYAFVVIKSNRIQDGIVKGLLLTLGSFFAYFVCFLPYIISGKLLLLKKSVWDASLAYSNVGISSMIDTLPVVIALILLAFISYLFSKPKNKATYLLLPVLVFGLGFMFFKSGKINGHYLIQIFPFVSISFVSLISLVFINKRFTRKNVLKILIILGLLLPIESYIEYFNVVKNKAEKGTFYNGEGIEVSQYIKSNFKAPKNVLFLNEHIAYWFLSTRPLTAIATHPSNIFRENLYPFIPNTHTTALEEWEFILSKNPEFVVFDIHRSSVPYDSPYSKTFQKKLKKDYQLIKTFGNVQLYCFKKNFLN